LVGAFGEDAELIEDLQYQDVVDGPLILQVDKAIDLIFTKYFKALIDYEGVQRTETNMLTRGIVRELLLNAINHKDYATGVPIQVSVYEDKIVIFNMGTWSKRVPTDERIYEKHESVPNNPKIADVSFRSGDVESWGRGFLKIKAECNAINAPLPVIDAEYGGVSVSAVGCEKYMSLLRYGQYGQVGVDGVWRDKESENEELKHSSVAIGLGVIEYARLLEFLNEPRTRQEIQEYCGYKSKDYFRKHILNPLIESGKVDMTIPEKPHSSKQKYVRHANK
jgi:ATP-dependent DNA helicase RecG